MTTAAHSPESPSSRAHGSHWHLFNIKRAVRPLQPTLPDTLSTSIEPLPPRQHAILYTELARFWEENSLLPQAITDDNRRRFTAVTIRFLHLDTEGWIDDHYENQDSRPPLLDPDLVQKCVADYYPEPGRVHSRPAFISPDKTLATLSPEEQRNRYIALAKAGAVRFLEIDAAIAVGTELSQREAYEEAATTINTDVLAIYGAALRAMLPHDPAIAYERFE